MMGNTIDYVGKNNEKRFSEEAFNEIDNLVLSQASYFQLEYIPGFNRELTFRDVAACEDTRVAGLGILEKDNRKLLSKLVESERFANVRLTNYATDTDPELEKQFSATTYLLDDGTAYIAFRGTDSTLVGWKEDFNLCYAAPIHAQTGALEYLQHAANRLDCPLRVGGHSKGGNLAVYASAHSPMDIQSRIMAVYCNDGPGMDEDTFASEGNQRIQQKIHSFVPQSSIIGMLLLHPENYTVVNSSGFSIMQHNPFYWQVEDNHFIVIDKLRRGSQYMDTLIKNWLRSVDEQERMVFINTFYSLLAATKAETLGQLAEGALKNGPAVLAAVSSIDDKTRKIILQVFSALLNAAIKSYSK